MIIEATKKENLIPTLAKDESLQREEKPLFFYHSNFSTPYKSFTWPAWQQFLVDLMNHSRNQQRTDQRVLVLTLEFLALIKTGTQKIAFSPVKILPKII